MHSAGGSLIPCCPPLPPDTPLATCQIHQIHPQIHPHATYGMHNCLNVPEYVPRWLTMPYMGCLSSVYPGSICIQGVSWVNPLVYQGESRVYLGKGVNRLAIGRQFSAEDRSLGVKYTGYTPDTQDAPKIHLRYTPGYTIDTPHIHPRYTLDTPGPGSQRCGQRPPALCRI